MCDAKIGPAPNITAIYPATSSPEDNLAAMDFDQLRIVCFWIQLALVHIQKHC